MKKKRILEAARDERGNALVIAILLVFATSIIGAIVAMMSSTDIKISGNQELATEAQFAAEAGLAEAIHRLALPYPTNVVIGGKTVNASIADMPPIDPDYKAYITMTAAAENPTVSGSTMTAGTLQNLGGDYITYSKASGTSEVITVEHKWKDLDGDGTREAGEIVLYDSGQVPPENFTKGYPIEIVTVTGASAGAKRAIQAEVTRLRVNFKTLGALYLDKAATVSGSSVFCGYNHDIGTTPGTTLNACYAFHETDGHLSGVATTGDVVDIKGDNKTDGVPKTNTSNTNVWYTLPEVLGLTSGETNEILANADQTSILPVMDGVTYIQGNARINATNVGHGLLYITGNATINGGFKYWGLIYIEGDCKIVGTPWILGTMLVKGSADFQFSAGNCGVLFSEEAITQYLGAFMPMVTLAWRDL